LQGILDVLEAVAHPQHGEHGATLCGEAFLKAVVMVQLFHG
jgi:hypothetical protein